MKSIREIANELGVSKQAIQKRISREPLCTSLSPYISTVGGAKYIAEEGILIIKSAYSKTEPTTTTNNVHIDNPDNVQPILSILQNELEAKNKIIEQQQQSINDLTTALENTTASLHAAQALHAGTMQKQIEAGENQKKSIFPWKKKKPQI